MKEINTTHHKESKRNKKEVLKIVERLGTYEVKRDYGGNVSLDKKHPMKQVKKSLLVTHRVRNNAREKSQVFYVV